MRVIPQIFTCTPHSRSPVILVSSYTMYLVVIAVLSIVLAFPEPVWSWLADPPLVMLAAAAATVLPAALAVGVSRRALRLLEEHPDQPSLGQAALGRGGVWVQSVLGLTQAGLLLATDWQRLCAGLAVIGDWPVVPALLAIFPFMLGLLLVWVALYPADRAVRQIALEVYLFRGRPVRPVWHLPEYLVYHLRHQLLFVLIPMLLILLARDVILLNERRLRSLFGASYVADLLLGTAALLVAVITPAILRRVWATQRLPAGPLRDKLVHLCRLLRVRCREILVWQAGGMIVNAAVMGVVAPLRYVLITDGMLEQLDDAKIEAVFGHEAGHVKRHHIFYFLLFALISGCAVTIFSVRTQTLPADGLAYQAAALALGVVLLLKWGVVFGWISRRFERQADMFGVRALTAAGLPCRMPCAVHGRVVPEVPASTAGAGGTGGRAGAVEDQAARAGAAVSASPLAAWPAFVGGGRRSDALCASAALLFGNTLNEVAVLNGIPPEARSWRHGSISRRSRTLQNLAQDPQAVTRAERAVAGIKAAIFLLALAGSIWCAVELRVWELAL